jgi:hypothetical protein
LSVPDKLDARGIVSLVLSVLGINYERVRNLLVRRIGSDAKVKQLENGFDLVQRLANGGLVAAVQHMMHLGKTLQQLQTTVIESVRNWVIETVVRAAITQLVATFSGFGAIVVAAEGIYNAITFLIEKASQIQALLDAVAASIGNIVAGKVSEAANYIESTLARSLSVTINFLAQIVRLGNVGQKVRDIIGRVRARVDVAVNNLVDYVAKQGKTWLAGRSSGSRPQPRSGSNSRPTTPRQPGQPTTPNPGNTGNLAAKLRDREIGQTQTFKADGESHRLWIEVNKRNQATVMLASDPTPLRDFLNRQDVNKLNNRQTDPNDHVEKARKILGTVNYDAGLLIAALTQNKSQEAEAKDKEIEKAMQELAEHLKWIFPQLKKAHLEIAKAVFGDRLFTSKELRLVFPYIRNDNVVRAYLADWVKDKVLHTNRTSEKDTSPKVRYSFNKDTIKELIKQQNSNQTPTNKTTPEDRIKYYQQILIWAGYTKNELPDDPREYTEKTLTEYRRRMRELILQKFGDDIKKLDAQVLSKIARQAGRTSFCPLKSEIFKQWIVKNIPGVQEVASITFIVISNKRETDKRCAKIKKNH